jgi:hypothetical protein
MNTKLVLFLVAILLLPLLTESVDPVLDAQRKQVLLDFIPKLSDSFQLAVSNFTEHVLFVNGTPQYTYCVDVTGCFGGLAAEDYLGIVFVLVPIPTSNGVIYERFLEITYGVSENAIRYVETLPQGDRYVANYYINASQLNFVTGTRDIGDGITYTGSYIFAPNSNKIISEVVNSTLGVEFFGNAAPNVPASQICSGMQGIPGVLEAACPAGSPYEQFSSYEDCMNQMTQVETQQENSICPDVLTSNTTGCRNIHYLTALAAPPESQMRHCPHAQVPSPTCQDRCLSGCSNCNANARCVFTPTVTGQRQYACKCKNGYVGDGVYSCVQKTCSAQYECGTDSQYNRVQCSSGQCKCRPSFEWNPTTGTCDLPPNTNLVYNNGEAVALPVGRCYEQWQCSNAGLGDYNSMKCLQFGTNAFIPYKSCVCNYGYEGAFDVPCVCKTGKTVVYSNTLNGNVCLSPSECIADYNCAYPKTCNLTTGKLPGVVGLCQ